MTAIEWDFGSAFDFFISLFVIHHPDRFGLRAAWAAGVRSRLNLEDRQFMEEALTYMPVPLSWVNQLPLKEKNTRAVLDYFAGIPPEKRLITLFSPTEMPAEVTNAMARIHHQQRVTAEDLKAFRMILQNRTTPIKTREVKQMAEAFLDPAAFGERLLSVFNSYFQSFFAEEEERILPALLDGLQFAKKQAKELPLAQLVDLLSHGVKVADLDTFQKVILTPSYWSSPLNFFYPPRPEELLFVFGCRQDTQNLIPGEYVPDSLVSGLKALADPTRLRILHYLYEGTTTPSSLARRLRLRAPTVIHHLNTLRLAGMIKVTIKSSGERCYSLHQDAIDAAFQQVNAIIKNKKD